uniref:FBD domain-containing protein n=1 Tax=Triticum urartu TaxID=4572 RepID=A0A8R7PJQ2_TRIUA
MLAVSSASLQELVLHQTDWMDGVNIVAPVLRQLTVSFSAMEKVSISVLAPMVEMVSWRCCYFKVSIVFGVWRLEQVTLQTAQTPGQLPSLQIHASANSIFVCEEETFMHEIEKHMIAEFSVLELHLETNGHVFGALAFHVLGMNRICSAMQKLKVILQRSSVKEGCSPHCPCESMGWRSQTISLTGTEEVEISGCGGDGHEIDFLKLILKCAPMLKKMIVKLSDGASSSDDGCTNIYNIFKAYSSVELYVYLSSDYDAYQSFSICILCRVNARQPRLTISMIVMVTPGSVVIVDMIILSRTTNSVTWS